MTGSEIEDLAFSESPEHSSAETVYTVPGFPKKYDFRIRDMKRLTVQLGLRDFELDRNSIHDWMFRLYDGDPTRCAVIANSGEHTVWKVDAHFCYKVSTLHCLKCRSDQ